MLKVFFLILCSLIPSAVLAKNSLTVRVTDFKPYYYQNRDGVWHGMAVELVGLVLKEAGIKPVYEKIPWERSLFSIKKGGLDIMMNLSITKERKKFLYFIGPHLDEIITLVVRKDFNKKISSLNDLKKLSGGLGIERGNYYGKDFKYKKTHDVDFAGILQDVTSTEQNYKKLRSGRIDGLLTGRYSIAYKIRHYPGFRNFKIYPFVVNRNPVYIGVSKKSVPKALFLRLKKAFEKIRDDGRLEKLVQSYM